MRLSVDTEANKAFKINIELTDTEKKDFIHEGVVTFSLCLARLAGEFIQNASQTKEQAKVLSSIILEMQQDMLKEYVDTLFEDIQEIREEAELYSYMEDVFKVFLGTAHLTKEQFLQKYKGSKTLKYEPVITGDTVTVVLSNGLVGDILCEFPVALIEEDFENYHRTICMAYIASVIAADLLFDGEDNNPIRQNPAGDGDGGLNEQISHLLNQK